MTKLDLLTMITAGAAAGVFALGYLLDAFTGAELIAALIGIVVVIAAIVNTQGE